MSVFTPDLILNNITDISLDMIKENGIKGIVLDVDNTLTLHNSQDILQVVKDWLKTMQENGIKLTILSNNYEERIKPFADKIGLDYIAFGCKPLTVGYTKALAQLGLSKKEVAVVGDQIYTDILGGNLKGIFTILVIPFQLENTWLFKFKRKMERMHIRKYKRIIARREN